MGRLIICILFCVGCSSLPLSSNSTSPLFFFEEGLSVSSHNQSFKQTMKTIQPLCWSSPSKDTSISLDPLCRNLKVIHQWFSFLGDQPLIDVHSISSVDSTDLTSDHSLSSTPSPMVFLTLLLKWNRYFDRLDIDNLKQITSALLTHDQSKSLEENWLKPFFQFHLHLLTGKKQDRKGDLINLPSSPGQIFLEDLLSQWTTSSKSIVSLQSSNTASRSVYSLITQLKHQLFKELEESHLDISKPDRQNLGHLFTFFTQTMSAYLLLFQSPFLEGTYPLLIDPWYSQWPMWVKFKAYFYEFHPYLLKNTRLRYAQDTLKSKTLDSPFLLYYRIRLAIATYDFEQVSTLLNQWGQVNTPPFSAESLLYLLTDYQALPLSFKSVLFPWFKELKSPLLSNIQDEMIKHKLGCVSLNPNPYLQAFDCAPWTFLQTYSPVNLSLSLTDLETIYSHLHQFQKTLPKQTISQWSLLNGWLNTFKILYSKVKGLNLEQYSSLLMSQSLWGSEGLNLLFGRSKRNPLNSRSNRLNQGEESALSTLLSPASVQPLWVLVDQLLTQGYPLSKVVQSALQIDFVSPFALKWYKALPHLAPLSSFHQNPNTIIEQYEHAPWGSLAKGPLGQVYDEQTIIYDPLTGRGMRRVYEIIRINNKKGVETLGEVTLPNQAVLVDLYTLKKSRRKVPPLLIPQKESYSLQELQPQDYVVAHYLEVLDTIRPQGGILTPRIYLQDGKRSLYYKRLILFVPPDSSPTPLSLTWQGFQLNQIKDSQWNLTQREYKGGTLYQLDVHQVPALKVEKHGLDLSFRLPSLRAGIPTTQKSLSRQWFNLIKDHLHISTDLSQWMSDRFQFDPFNQLKLNSISPSKASIDPHFISLETQHQIEKIIEFTWNYLTQSPPLSDSASVVEAIYTHKGSRFALMSTVLSFFKIPHELCLARPHLYTPTAPFLTLDDFSHLLIRISRRNSSSEPTRSTWIDLQLPQSPFNLLSPSLRGGQALCLPHDASNSHSSSLRSIQWMDTSPDQHQVSIKLKADPTQSVPQFNQKGLKLIVNHHFIGVEGLLLAHRLSQVSPHIQKGWIERQWSSWGISGRVQNVQIDSHHQTLKLKYEIKARVSQSFDFQPLSQNWLSRFSLTQRKTPYLLEPLNQKVIISWDQSLFLKDTNQKKGVCDAMHWHAPPYTTQHVKVPSFEQSSKILNFDVRQSHTTQSIENPPQKVTFEKNHLLPYFPPKLNFSFAKNQNKDRSLSLEWKGWGGLLFPKDALKWEKWTHQINRCEHLHFTFSQE